jgi:hypothetical protein
MQESWDFPKILPFMVDKETLSLGPQELPEVLEFRYRGRRDFEGQLGRLPDVFRTGRVVALQQTEVEPGKRIQLSIRVRTTHLSYESVVVGWSKTKHEDDILRLLASEWAWKTLRDHSRHLLETRTRAGTRVRKATLPAWSTEHLEEEPLSEEEERQIREDARVCGDKTRVPSYMIDPRITGEETDEDPDDWTDYGSRGSPRSLDWEFGPDYD